MNKYINADKLKIAIKGDGTEEYGKKIIKYFTSSGCSNNNNFSCYGEGLYYFINYQNNLWWELHIPEGYTETSLKEEEEEYKYGLHEVIEDLSKFGSKSDEIIIPRTESPMKKINELSKQVNDAMKLSKGIMELHNRNKKLETYNAALFKELTELKLKLKDLSK